MRTRNLGHTALISKPSPVSSVSSATTAPIRCTPANLPAWCGGITAPDAVDATIYPRFRGQWKKALAELARRFELTKAEEQRKVAALIFRLRRDGATQAEIETAAPGRRRAGSALSRAEIIRVALLGSGSKRTTPCKLGRPRDGRRIPSLADPAAQANKLRKPTATAGETTQDTDLIRALVAEFNDRYMVVSEAGKVMLYEPDTDPLLKRRFYQRLDFGTSTKCG